MGKHRVVPHADTASGTGRQEEKGASVSPEQPLVQWEKKNSQLTFEGAFSTAPGHKQGAQQTWVLYPPSLKLKSFLNKKNPTLLPNISKPFSFTTHSSAAYLLPECSSQGRQWPSNQAVLPLTWTLLSAHHSCARLSSRNLCPPWLLWNSPTFSISFSGSLAGSFFTP